MKIPPRLGEFAEATAFLTRYPLPGLLFPEKPAGAAAAWAFPLAGMIAAALPALMLGVLTAAGAGGLVAAFTALIVYALVTGGLHQDGLADAADGLFGGRNREHALAIMKDSRAGSYGALALVLVTGLKAASLAELADASGTTAAAMLLAAAATGRAAMVGHWHHLPGARAEGAAASLGRPDMTVTIAAILLAALAVAILGPASGMTGPASGALAASAAITGLFSYLVRRRIAGHTGDTLGATAEIGETAFLAALAILS